VLGRNGGDESVGCGKIANVHPEKWSIVWCFFANHHISIDQLYIVPFLHTSIHMGPFKLLHGSSKQEAMHQVYFRVNLILDLQQSQQHQKDSWSWIYSCMILYDVDTPIILGKQSQFHVCFGVVFPHIQ
jgi:hypothetical protein